MTQFIVPKGQVFVPHHLGELDVAYDGKDFSIMGNGKKSHQVQRMDLSEDLRGISTEQLQKILQYSYLALSKIGNDYSLQLKGRLPGGGPVAGFIGYGVTKILGCAGIALGGQAAVGAGTGGIVVVQNSNMNPQNKLAATATIGAGVATGIVASAVGTGTALGAVETASVAVGGILTAIPFLP